MKQSFQFGENKTGIKTNPEMARQMIEGAQELSPAATESSLTSKTFRQAYIEETGVLGSVPEPPPGELEAEALLLDKLGERLAFERAGVRLYSSLIRRCEVEYPEANIEGLRKIREEEREHFEYVRDCIENLGGDSTAQTPCANAIGVANAGLVQLMNDPRTDLPQAVQAILVAELADNVAWEMLILLSEQCGVGETDLDKFKRAKQEEEDHLIFVKSWLLDLMAEGSGGEFQQKTAV